MSDWRSANGANVFTADRSETCTLRVLALRPLSLLGWLSPPLSPPTPLTPTAGPSPAASYDRDFEYDYFGFKTLEKSYLLKMHGKVVERPQQMLMRVAIGIHKHDLDAAIETYHLMSDKWFTHATPTMFNAGTPSPQMSSCFLLSMKEVT